MNIIGIIPTRMKSSRLPGKPMKKIFEIPMIGHVYLRSKLSKILSDVYVATCDTEIKDYVQSHKILSDPISHFGDEMGGNWGHWILWSSIITSSKIKKDSNKKFMSKIQYSTLAMVSNGLITVGMKRAFGRERPNGSCCDSFPSGHTSHSFTMASIANELYGKNIGLISYGLATLVAVSRMNDNKHYLSDVIFGAGLGTAVGRAFSKNYQKLEETNIQVGFSSQMALKISVPIN